MRYEIIVALILLPSQLAFAQQVVQQPVVSVTSVTTTVSVPDRGSAFLGGVSSAQSGRSQYGPLRSGTSAGLSRQATSISTSVTIHDLQAMDEALLNSGPPNSDSGRPSSRVLSDRFVTQNSEITPGVLPAEKAAKFEQLARKAHEAGKRGVAKLHWQVAAKYGSKLAETRLAELSQTPSPQSTRTAAH